MCRFLKKSFTLSPFIFYCPNSSFYIESFWLLLIVLHASDLGYTCDLWCTFTCLYILFILLYLLGNYVRCVYCIDVTCTVLSIVNELYLAYSWSALWVPWQSTACPLSSAHCSTGTGGRMEWTTNPMSTDHAPAQSPKSETCFPFFTRIRAVVIVLSDHYIIALLYTTEWTSVDTEFHLILYLGVFGWLYFHCHGLYSSPNKHHWHNRNTLLWTIKMVASRLDLIDWFNSAKIAQWHHTSSPALSHRELRFITAEWYFNLWLRMRRKEGLKFT